MDFNKYKNELQTYLNHKGIEINGGLINCINPNHADHNPSCQVSEGHFHCYSCGVDGDIYDAVELLEGITEKAEQYKFLEKLFGGSYTPAPYIKKEKPEIKTDTEAEKKFIDYIHNHPDRESKVKNFLNQRALQSSHGKIKSYPEKINATLQNFFGYWPGLTAARKDGLDNDFFNKVFIPLEKVGKNYSSWSHNGIVVDLSVGHKLHYYSNGKCEKRGTEHCHTFPTPKIQGKKIILTEGELDALVCQAAGINAYSTGGTSGLTKTLAEKEIANSDLEEIIFLYDNDTAGSEAAPKRAQLIKDSGFKGKIKIAATKELKNFKDPDEAILFGHTDFVLSAIANAVDFTKAEKPTTAPATKKTAKGNMPIRAVKQFLTKLPKKDVDESEAKMIASTLINACKDYDQTVQALITWGIDTNDIPPVDSTVDIFPLISVAKKHNENFGHNYATEMRKYLINEYDFNNLKDTVDTLIDIDIKPLIDAKSKDLEIFIKRKADGSEKEAANLMEFFYHDKLIYNEETKEFYFFDGLIWSHRPDETDIAYNTLKAISLQYFDNDYYKADFCLTKISKYSYCKTVMKALAEKPSIFRKRISFDDIKIKETLTLQDGVLDFSGNEIVIRDAKPEEYRQQKLPYFCDEIKDKKTPKEFIKFMEGNFDNKATLNSLMYFLSTIPSRSATFKIGGIFTGKPHTGKTTTMELISTIYPEMIAPIPRSLIMQSRYGNDDSGPNPYIARLEGKGAGVSDETEKNDKLNSSTWKKLTGFETQTARGLYMKPHDFKPTAQTIILTNYSPLFDSTDQAVIDRMLIIQFAKQHEKGAKDTLEFEDLVKKLQPEFPQVVRLFAEYYIRLKKEMKSKIPLSDESVAYKDDYIEKMDDNGIQTFVSKYIDFEKGSGKTVLLKDVYLQYCQFWDVILDGDGKPIDPEKLTQSKFTRYFKRDYNEVKIKQLRVKGYDNPQQVCVDMVMKPLEETAPVTPQIPEQQTPPPPQPYTPEEEEENPFENEPEIW